MSAVINGYSIEQTPEDEVRERFIELARYNNHTFTSDDVRHEISEVLRKVGRADILEGLDDD